ncbi:hypothetical protein [Bacillus phage SBSphiJ6]|uniref:Uncharacterized protein n=1 Tax=Bacillus phage Grass TaxID=1406785 RepID=U5PU08_BPGRA|nr:hypothetical protein Grass_124 [Bacillus phage Grass]UPI11876.1 hypothetical protein [Bacillus phage SBSphiJ1]UPI12128.1 hypothetical protein [Bacillus phage SBSphiJ2]UPI12383.1 hypothetical protein [Bacillus phage SBSphiJ3]UPI12635.1 hypothetical protein [Bacillus phage SBSphiJ4]UPI12885.1 hypothetical protein [Bacillus phage SBSphiJ5]UPI13125.1 hypothetical protein [Bacillus phage SBSphiJ6]UPI13374.1 hypothetical protein [Bacillus phage SBSphiJ7]
MKMLKLSELPDDTELGVDGSGIIQTVSEIKWGIQKYGEPYHLEGDWYTIKRKKWRPDATRMLEGYIEDELDDMYDDWDERAWDCLPDEVVSKIQGILNEAFKGDYATAYWTYEQPVDIDIYPYQKG